jgi:hypothetical protein
MINIDLISIMEKVGAVYGYQSELIDNPKCSSGLPSFIINWMQQVRKTQLGEQLGRARVRFGGPKITKSLEVNNLVYNCNFEVVKLDFFRHPHYKAFWDGAYKYGLFFRGRVGDHHIKTSYLDLYSNFSQVVCFQDLPYYHYYSDISCSQNTVVQLANCKL